MMRYDSPELPKWLLKVKGRRVELTHRVLTAQPLVAQYNRRPLEPLLKPDVEHEKMPLTAKRQAKRDKPLEKLPKDDSPRSDMGLPERCPQES